MNGMGPPPESTQVAPRYGKSCQACHLRKVRCDMSRHGAPCSRCQQLNIHCNTFVRRQRAGRLLDAICKNRESANLGTQSPAAASSPVRSAPPALEELTTAFASLGVGDSPRVLAVPGLGDVSKQTSILVDWLSQDFSETAVSDYQVTFNDNYDNIARLLAQEFGQGYEDEVYHYPDAPFIKRSNGGLPRTLTPGESTVLELQGAFVLPGKHIADSFVNAFFDRVHPMLPIVDRSGFMRRYYSMTTEEMTIPLLLLQSILLSGSTTFKHPSLPLPTADVSWRLYVRTKSLIENRFEQDRLVLVQSHLLISTFTCDSCDDTIQNMWLSIGTAVRIAQGLGLHRSLGNAKASVPMRREWKRIWWSLFVHDTLCSFEWGRPRAINLADCDVELLSDEDFLPEEAGTLYSAEQTNFFKEICNLCFLITDWLDLLRPSRVRKPRASVGMSQPDKMANTRTLMDEIYTWHGSLPAVLRPPASLSSFSLWAGTIHVAYCAVLLRLAALLPGESTLVDGMAVEITKTCCDLHEQGLLYSLWNFGIHELDLAMGYHARRVNSTDRTTASAGLEHLQLGIPLMQHLCERSSVAVQGTKFYELLATRAESGLPLKRSHDRPGRSGGNDLTDNQGDIIGLSSFDMPVWDEVPALQDFEYLDSPWHQPSYLVGFE